jgi:uncharacterized membrane protein YsdA (DUF1294 family)/cold shock CspA family protein
MEQRGQLASWNDAKGFGFIQPELGGAPVFVHISAMRGAQRPQPGEQVLFVAGKDQQGRLRAEHMRLPGLCLDRPAIRRKPPAATVQLATPQLGRAKPAALASKRLPRKSAGAAPTIQYLPVKLLLFAALGFLPLYGGAQLLLKHAVIWPLCAYAGVSLLSFAQYWQDKHSAQKGRWRTAENTLQLTALLGGWPGALVAQQVFRHKTRKLEFQLPFWLIVLAHQVFWLDWLLLKGRYFGAPLRALLAY